MAGGRIAWRVTAALFIGGCGPVLDQDRPVVHRAAATTGPAVATADLGTAPPLPGLTPPPKPFFSTAQFAAEPGHPSPLLVEHAVPEPPLPLSVYGQQPVRPVSAFDLGPSLTAAALRRQLGPPAGMADLDDPWVVYRLTYGREIWLHFAGGDGPLTAADLVRGAENGYVRQRLYPEN